MAVVEVGKFIAKFPLGFISDKLRDCATKKLQDGGLTNEKFKGYITRDLTEIDSKLDGISRKELSASISCLKKGVLRLYISFESGNAGASSAETRPAETTITVDDALALANAIGKLKINSSDLFEKARESFKQAGIDATGAFHNTALNIEERILANKVRMASALLENLDHPEVAASDCRLFLEELHAMPAIQEIFSVHFKRGIKSYFKKDSRIEAIKAVTMMNLILADFITKFTKLTMAVFDWPMIYCDGLVIHPIHYDEDCSNKMKKLEITPPWDLDLLQKMLQSAARLSGDNDSNSRIKSTPCCVPYGDDIKRGFLILQMHNVNDIRELRLAPVNLHSYKHCVTVDEDDYVYVLKVSIFPEIFSAQIYTGDGSLLNDIRIRAKIKYTLPQLLCFYFDGSQSYHPGARKDEDDGNLIPTVYWDIWLHCWSTNTPTIIRFANLLNLYDDDGDAVLPFNVIQNSIDMFTYLYNTTILFFHEVAFVYTREYQMKGTVHGLYPNCTDSPSSSSSLWDRYLPVVNVTADGKTAKTSRCLHSRENLKILFSKAF